VGSGVGLKLHAARAPRVFNSKNSTTSGAALRMRCTCGFHHAACSTSINSRLTSSYFFMAAPLTMRFSHQSMRRYWSFTINPASTLLRVHSRAATVIANGECHRHRTGGGQSAAFAVSQQLIGARRVGELDIEAQEDTVDLFLVHITIADLEEGT